RSYLEPNGITSMLDAAVRRRGELVGVICLEHVGRPRRWTTAEEIFACALADLVSLALEAAERQEADEVLPGNERLFRGIREHTPGTRANRSPGQGGRPLRPRGGHPASRGGVRPPQRRSAGQDPRGVPARRRRRATHRELSGLSAGRGGGELRARIASAPGP